MIEVEVNPQDVPRGKRYFMVWDSMRSKVVINEVLELLSTVLLSFLKWPSIVLINAAFTRLVVVYAL